MNNIETAALLDDLMRTLPEIGYCMLGASVGGVYHFPTQPSPNVDPQIAQIFQRNCAAWGVLITELAAASLCQPVDRISIRLRPSDVWIEIFVLSAAAHLVMYLPQPPKIYAGWVWLEQQLVALADRL